MLVEKGLVQGLAANDVIMTNGRGEAGRQKEEPSKNLYDIYSMKDTAMQIAQLQNLLTEEARRVCDDAMANRYLRATAGDVHKVMISLDSTWLLVSIVSSGGSTR